MLNLILIDASKLGTKIKDGKNQKTVLSKEEIEMIQNTFINREVIDDFSVVVGIKEIQNKKYSFSAGQYFDIKMEQIDISEEEFNSLFK